MFVAAQGSPRSRFRRAIDAQSVLLAELSAREMRHVDLADALELVLLYGNESDPKYERAACRWLGRLAAEQQDVTLGQLQLAASALAALPAAPAASRAALRGLLRRPSVSG